LVVTDEGRKRIVDARNGRRRLLREQLDRWPPEEVATLAKLLGRYNQQMNAALGKE
jgi:DNA-binding MarR family transcriptional regulator